MKAKLKHLDSFGQKLSRWVATILGLSILFLAFLAMLLFRKDLLEFGQSISKKTETKILNQNSSIRQVQDTVPFDSAGSELLLNQKQNFTYQIEPTPLARQTLIQSILNKAHDKWEIDPNELKEVGDHNLPIDPFVRLN